MDGTCSANGEVRNVYCRLESLKKKDHSKDLDSDGRKSGKQCWIHLAQVTDR